MVVKCKQRFQWALQMLVSEFCALIKETTRKQLSAMGYVPYGNPRRNDDTDSYRLISEPNECSISVVINNVHEGYRSVPEASVSIIFRRTPGSLEGWPSFRLQPRDVEMGMRAAFERIIGKKSSSPLSLEDQAAIVLINQENGPKIMREFLPNHLVAQYLGGN